MKPIYNRIITGLTVAALLTAVALVMFYPAEKKDYTIAVIGKSSDTGIEFWTAVNKGIELAAEEQGVHVTIDAPLYESDVAGQIALTDEVIARKPDGVIFIPTDEDALIESAKKMKAAKIPYVCLDSDVNLDDGHVLIATDNFAAGQKAGKTLHALTGGQGKIIVAAHSEISSTGRQRISGFFDGYGTGASALPVVYSDSVPENAYNGVYQLLTEHPDVTGIVGLNEPSTVGAVNAARDLGLLENIHVVGFDSSLTEIKYLESGAVSAVVSQEPFNMGYLSLTTMCDILNGKKVKGNVLTSTRVITRENMYDEENQKFLFMFME